MCCTLYDKCTSTWLIISNSQLCHIYKQWYSGNREHATSVHVMHRCTAAAQIPHIQYSSRSGIRIQSAQQQFHMNRPAQNVVCVCSSSASPWRHPCFFLETTYAMTAAADTRAVTAVSTCLSCCCMAYVMYQAGSSQNRETLLFCCCCCYAVAWLDWHLLAVLQNKTLRDAYLFTTGSGESWTSKDVD